MKGICIFLVLYGKMRFQFAFQSVIRGKDLSNKVFHLDFFLNIYASKTGYTPRKNRDIYGLCREDGRKGKNCESSD